MLIEDDEFRAMVDFCSLTLNVAAEIRSRKRMLRGPSQGGEGGAGHAQRCISKPLPCKNALSPHKMRHSTSVCQKSMTPVLTRACTMSCGCIKVANHDILATFPKPNVQGAFVDYFIRAYLLGC